MALIPNALVTGQLSIQGISPTEASISLTKIIVYNANLQTSPLPLSASAEGTFRFAESCYEGENYAITFLISVSTEVFTEIVNFHCSSSSNTLPPISITNVHITSFFKNSILNNLAPLAHQSLSITSVSNPTQPAEAVETNANGDFE